MSGKNPFSFLKSDQLTDSPDQLKKYGADWTKQFPNQASLVLFPESTDDVQKIVKVAFQNRIGIVPSGGRTGLSGGACATQGEVVLSLERMNRILNFNPYDRSVLLQAGVITQALQDFAKEKGFLYPVDFAARGSSQIGGNIATNAGGIKVLRYGMTRNWVSGLTLIDGRGERYDFNRGLIKNATGLDFRHLIIGSEGILGVVTEAEIQLTKPPGPTRTLLLALPELDGVMKVFELFRSRLQLQAFEFFSELALQTVTRHHHLERPFSLESVPTDRDAKYVIIEVEAESPGVDEEINSIFESLLTDEVVIDGLIAQSETQARIFWRYREDISEATAPMTPYKNDISVRIEKVPEFLLQTNSSIKKHYSDFQVVWFGHVGDGNLHINILKPDHLSAVDFVKKCEGVNKILFQIISDLGGAISAEHGVGLLKKPYLNMSRNHTEIEMMKSIKKIFDPANIMNPGKIFDLNP